MCYSCGTGDLDDDHGEPEIHLTNKKFADMAKAHNMSEEEAKMNTFDALRNELGNVIPEEELDEELDEDEEL